MRKIIYWMLALFICSAASMNAQMLIGNTGVAEPTPHAGSILDLQSTNKGLLLPKVSLQNVNSLNPLTGDLQEAKGMVVYNTNASVINGSGTGLYIWDGTKWRTVSVNGGAMTTTPATLPVFTKDGGIADITVSSPGCDISGPFTFLMITGSGYAAINLQTSFDGKFTIGFAANTTALEREAVILAVDPCGETASFTFKQEGNSTVCQGTRYPIINVSNSGLLCTNGAVYMDIANAENDVDYVWTLNNSKVGSGTTYTATQAGTYVVYAGSSGCTYKTSQTVTASGSSAPVAPANVIASNGGVLCTGGTVQLSVLNPSAGTIDWYKDGIKQGSGTNIILSESSQAGEWFTVVNSGNGCLSKPSSPITVTISGGTALNTPQFSINGQTNLNNVTFCKGGSLTMQIVNTSDYDSGCNFQWFVNGVALNPAPASASYHIYNVPSDITQLTLSVSVSKAGSCGASVSSPVKTVSQTASSATNINNNGSTFICGTDPAILTTGVSNASEYYWYHDGVKKTTTTTNVYTTTQAGSYQVAYKDVQGCVSFLSSPVIVAYSNTVSLFWKTAPSTAIIGQTLTYSVNAAPAPEAFEWTADNGATIISLGATSGQANITFNNQGATNVTVSARSGCGPVSLSKSVAANPACMPVSTIAMTPNTNFEIKVNQTQTIAVTSSDGSAEGKTYIFYENGVQKQSGSSNTYNFAPTTTGNYAIKAAVKNNCTSTAIERIITAAVTVDPIVIPEPENPGVYSLSGTTCFDIAQTEGGTTCGALSGRTNAFASTKTFTYTFANTASFTNLIFVKDDVSSMIRSINHAGGNTVNITFDDNITTLAKATDNTTAKTAVLYAVFNDNNNIQRKVGIKLSVKDCWCCPGFMKENGVYIPKFTGNTSALSGSTNLDFATVASYFTATNESLCFYKKDGNGGTGLTWNAATANGATPDGTSCINGSWADGNPGWRLPNIAELAAITEEVGRSDFGATGKGIGAQPSAASGTVNMGYRYIGSSLQAAGNVWRWYYDAAQARYYAKDAANVLVRCVRNY